MSAVSDSVYLFVPAISTETVFKVDGRSLLCEQVTNNKVKL